MYACEAGTITFTHFLYLPLTEAVRLFLLQYRWSPHCPSLLLFSPLRLLLRRLCRLRRSSHRARRVLPILCLAETLAERRPHLRPPAGLAEHCRPELGRSWRLPNSKSFIHSSIDLGKPFVYRSHYLGVSMERYLWHGRYVDCFRHPTTHFWHAFRARYQA